MAAEPVDDIVSWAATLAPWKQDCLRRLAASDKLSDGDYDELCRMVKSAAGFEVDPDPPAAIPMKVSDVGGGSTKPIKLKALENVQNVNRLVANAKLPFCPEGLTIVYGRNGSGKSGFVRILRTACRTRIENPEKLKVLSDVYGQPGGPQTADIIIDPGTGDIAVKWEPGKPGSPELMQVAVFDSTSAQLYVDGGNQIRFLPFGLALPHRLNAVCDELKATLEAERAAAVGDKIALTGIAFAAPRDTAAQQFCNKLNARTADGEIGAAAKFEAEDGKRLVDVTGILNAGATAAADLNAFITWIDNVSKECDSAIAALGDPALEKLSQLRSNAVTARQAADLAASDLFTDEPLPGVGSETWRALWEAAKAYSTTEAYKAQEFPVLSTDDREAACVLCQQPLLPEATGRMQRFQKHMDATLAEAARSAEQAVTTARDGLPKLNLLSAEDFLQRVEQVRQRDEPLANTLSAFQASVVKRGANALARLAGEDVGPMPKLGSPAEGLQLLLAALNTEMEELAKASNSEERTELEREKASLEDLQTLSVNKAKLTTRRDLLKLDAAYSQAIKSVNTKGITQRANELVDKHLTQAVVDRFDEERQNFEITHLKVGLQRRSGKLRAEFDVTPNTSLVKVSSEFLSEGEQRALALAGFLTEVALTDGSGPIIVDDPVSSLDRDRSAKVAERLAEEACGRQVVVFTHDMVFFNELCRAADTRCIEPVTHALYGDLQSTGKIDAGGIVWKGLNVKKRLGKLKDESARLPKLHAAGPADYEFEVKNLYGRLRDTHERVVEEKIFRDVVSRGSDIIKTQSLRMVSLSHDLAKRFHEGMTRANTHSHDNPASDTVPVPTPAQFQADIVELEQLVADLDAEAKATETARPFMK